MTRTSKISWVVGSSISIVLLTIALYAYGRARRGPDTVLPTFTEPGPGRRAPSADRFGFQVGRMRLPEASARLADLGIQCEDTSVRAVMDRMREAKKREVAEKEAKGEDPDTVTGASIIGHRTKREKNPQVRLSCERVSGRVLGEDWLADTTGRLLLVFDSAEHPLRHISFSRSHPKAADAIADQTKTTGSLELIHGLATGETASKPGNRTGDDAATDSLVRFERRAKTWEYGDLSVSVVLVAYSTLGPNVTETVEVPWPVRSDAPALPGPGAAQAAR